MLVATLGLIFQRIEASKIQELAQEQQQSLVRLNSAKSASFLNKKAPAKTLLWNTEALKKAEPNSSQAERLRLRNAMLLNTSPRIEEIFRAPAFESDKVKAFYGGLSPTRAQMLLPRGQGMDVVGLEQGKGLFSLETFNVDTISGQYDPTGNWILTRADESTLRVWDAGNGQPVGPPISVSSVVHEAAVASNGNVVAGLSGGIRFGKHVQRLHIWDVSSGKPIKAAESFGKTRIPFALAIDLASQTVAVAVNLTTPKDPTEKRTQIEFWDLQSGQKKDREISADYTWYYGLRFGPNGEHLLAASGSGAGRLYKVESGRLVARLTQTRDNPFEDDDIKGGVTGIFNPDDRRIATLGDKSIRLWGGI